MILKLIMPVEVALSNPLFWTFSCKIALYPKLTQNVRCQFVLPSLHANGQDLILGALRQKLATNTSNLVLLWLACTGLLAALWCFQLLSINDIISWHSLPDRGNRL
jgi:hypothetical protein